MLGLYSVIIDHERKIDRLVNEVDKSEVVLNRFGGEMIGYRIFDAASNRVLPLLYRDAIVETPEVGWKNHATILFPIVGGLKNKKSQFGDIEITSRGNHGFARHSLFELVETRDDGCAMIRYRLKSNPDTHTYYPFEFQFDLVYQLVGNNLSITFEITNPGSQSMYYQFGWHPGFATPIVNGIGSKENCRIVLPKGRFTRYHNNDACLLTGETSAVEVDGALIWTEKALEETLIFAIDDPAMRQVTLEDPASQVFIRMEFPDFPHLGLWSKQGDNFICIEPWQGMDDHLEQESFDQKLGIMRLEPGQVDKREIQVKPWIGKTTTACLP